jgi:hypothetical protein
LEIIELQFAADGARQAWYRFACDGNGIEEDVDDEGYLLARVDGTCVPVESSPNDAPAPVTTFPDPTPEGCHREPTVELVSSVDRVTMDLIYYNEMTETCGYAIDGEAMFDDAFRPASALFAPTRDLAIATDTDGSVSVDIRPLKPGMRVATSGPSRDVLAAVSDRTYPLALPGPGCFVVTIGWRGENRVGQFTGLAESQRGLCHNT